MNVQEILHRTDHTLLRAGCTEDEIAQLCEEAVAYECASVCIPPCYVSFAKACLGGQGGVKVCTVVGFPNGYSTAHAKSVEAREAIESGADEVDMVINMSFVKNRAWDSLREEISELRGVCDGIVLKVIIETCLLSEEEKELVCGIVTECGADYIKTSTGFSTGGATREDVALLRRHSADHLKVKAAGGIRSIEDAERFLELGASRLGTSKIVSEVKSMLNVNKHKDLSYFS